MSRNAAESDFESDDALVSRLAAGDQRALGTLYDRHGAAAYALACAVTARPTIAESVIADAFAQLWREASTFDPQRMSLLAWLMSIVRTRALAERGSDVAVPRVLSLTMRADERAESRNEPSHGLSTGVSELDAVQARAVELAFFGGMTKRQIAGELQLTESAVSQLLRRAIETLRHSLPRTDTASSTTSPRVPPATAVAP